MIKFGQKVKDIVTGFEGIVVARVEFINGCVQYALRPKVNDEGKLIDSEYFDVDRLRLVDDGIREQMKMPEMLVGGETPPASTTFD